MDEMNDKDRDLGPVLREAVRSAPETAQPSDLLWRRTRRSLRKRGLLRDRSSRSVRLRWSALVGAAALAGFLLGLGVGRSAPHAGPRPTATVAESPAAAVERVQGIGTDYTRALEALAHSLNGGTAAQVATGQQVLMALSEAHTELTRSLAPRLPEDELVARARPTGTGRSGESPLIWF